MKIEDALFDRNRQNRWPHKKRKNQKSFKEELEENLSNKKSELQKQINIQALDILA